MPHLERGKLITVPRPGHNVSMEAPEQLATVVREFARSGE